MADVRPLRLWPHDITEAQLAMIRQGKADMDVDFKILPSPAEPGGPGRVLAFGQIPPFFSESVVIGGDNVNRPESIRAAMEFALTAPAGAPGSFTEEAWLQAVMGVPVRYVGTEAV